MDSSRLNYKKSRTPKCIEHRYAVRRCPVPRLGWGLLKLYSVCVMLQGAFATPYVQAGALKMESFDVAKRFFIQRIAEAEKRIYVLSSAMDSTDIATALVLANYRGVMVRVLLNNRTSGRFFSRFDYLKRNAVNVRRVPFKSSYPYSVFIVDHNTYKFHAHLSGKLMPAGARLEIIKGQRATRFFSERFLSFYRRGTYIDPADLLIKLPAHYNQRKRRRYASPRRKRRRNNRLPGETILQLRKRKPVGSQTVRTFHSEAVPDKEMGDANTQNLQDSTPNGAAPVQIEVDEKSEPEEETL